MNMRQDVRRAFAAFDAEHGRGAAAREFSIGVPLGLVLVAIAAFAAAVLP